MDAPRRRELSLLTRSLNHERTRCVNMSPLRSNFAESTLATIPAFVIRPTKPESHAVYKAKKTDFALLKFLELKWVHIEAEQNVIA